MRESNYRHYEIDGTVSSEEWVRATDMLAEMGLRVVNVNLNECTNLEVDEKSHMARPPLVRIPYFLSQITSPGQYVSEEHFEEYWPIYRTNLLASGVRPPARGEHVSSTFRKLAHPHPRSSNYNLTSEAEIAYGSTLGLTIRPRSAVAGFGNGSKSYLVPHGTPTVIQAGSIVDFAHRARLMDCSQLPKHLSAAKMRFVAGFAGLLSKQFE